MCEARVSKCKFQDEKIQLYKNNRYYKNFVAEFEHAYEEELHVKENNYRKFAVRITSDKTGELSEDELDSITKKTILKEKNDKFKFGIKMKNKADKELSRSYESIVGAILVFLYVMIANFILFNDKLFYCLVGIVGMIAIVIIGGSVGNINIIKKKKKALAIYFDNDIFLKKYKDTFLLEINNDYLDCVKKARRREQVCKKEYFLCYRINKLEFEKKGDIGVAIFIMLVSLIGWITLFVISMRDTYQFVIWLVLTIIIVFFDLTMNDFIEKLIKINILKNTKKFKALYLINHTKEIMSDVRKKYENELACEYERRKIDAVLKESILSKKSFIESEINFLKKKRLEHRLNISISFPLTIIAICIFMRYNKALWAGITSIIGAIIIGILIVMLYKEKVKYSMKLKILQEMKDKL